MTPATKNTPLRDELDAEWQRLELARHVAVELIRFRAKNGLNQRQLAGLLGVKQPRIVDMESGEHNPPIETLIRIAEVTGIEFAIDISPRATMPKLLTKSAREQHGSRQVGEVVVTVASLPR